MNAGSIPLQATLAGFGADSPFLELDNGMRGSCVRGGFCGEDRYREPALSSCLTKRSDAPFASSVFYSFKGVQGTPVYSVG